MPDLSYFGNHVQVEIGDYDLVFIAAGLGDDLAARIAEVAFAIKFSDVPGLLPAHAVDCADEITIRSRVRRLLEFP